MSATIGLMEAFDESVEPWTTYIERFERFVEANSIDADKKVPVLLSVIGGNTYGLLRSLIAPDKPREKSFKQITDTLQQHFSPKPLIIAERFRFHRRSQEESESVTQYVAVLRGLSEHCLMEAFDESVEPWTTYIERFEHFVEANSTDADKKVPVLLSVIGGNTYGLLRSLIAPDKPREKSFKQITGTLQQHFSPKPLIIAERFRFHRRS
ncbi:voltage-dependent L-type calcium channel subunit alpha-1D-like protein [Labeo rohita]|uniref:Voltage-dependent L-type calcium channel subunit alpha-1D-like protein n=1 Tax=Labeo rohita TaxID=84645 RepID=A0A498LC02_LABRO|nr:voltage-dependent L-type calcium channel subunit alpha-1D-like protein [Labeo rohita]